MKTRQVKCPQCGKLSPFSSENKFRPFCSERCRTLDLGAWADERFRIPTKDPENSDRIHDLTDEDLEEQT